MPKVSFLGDQALASLVTLLKPPGTPLVSPEHTLLLGWGASPGLGLPGDARTCVTLTHRIPSSLPKPVPSQGRGSRPPPQLCGKAPTHRSHSRFSGKPRNCCPPGSEPPNSQLGQNAPKSQDGEAEKNPPGPLLACPGTARHGSGGWQEGLMAASRKLGQGGGTTLIGSAWCLSSSPASFSKAFCSN